MRNKERRYRISSYLILAKKNTKFSTSQKTNIQYIHVQL